MDDTEKAENEPEVVGATENMELGGNITLVGFKAIDYRDMIIVKKIVGSHTRRITEVCPEFQSLTITLKPVHKVEDNFKNELHLRVSMKGKVYAAETVDKNLFVAMDSVFKKVYTQLEAKC